MTKQEFKKLYHHARKTEFDFKVHMRNANYPCGYDDGMYESFDYHREEWLSDKPAIRYALTERYEWDYYQRKEECLAMTRGWPKEAKEREMKQLIKNKLAA